MESTFTLPIRGLNMLDTLQYTKQAIAAGFTQQQAEFQAEKMAELVNDTLVTKSYFKTEITSLEKSLRYEITVSEHRVLGAINKGVLSLLVGIPAIVAVGGALYHAIWK
jgi:hypothetical protein